MQLVARGGMELAWRAADTLGVLASAPEHRDALVAQGVVEEMVFLLQVPPWRTSCCVNPGQALRAWPARLLWFTA